jgi:4-amino-4-deoxy-L-arabinose transferase-like glycosyltransferase
MPTDGSADVPRWSDSLLVGLFALLLFGYAGFSGRPLTMHEARLPETSREMLARHELLLPTSGGRPWLERPPLPHWVVMSAMAVTGRVDRVWVVRLPSAVMGTVTVVLTVWMAGRRLGRTVAVLAGLVLATSYEFYLYACSAEDDVYLAALVAAAMALFVRRTFPAGDGGERRGGTFWGNRPWDVWAFFAVVGLTNLAKGPLLGVAFVGSAVGAFAVWDGLATRRWSTFARYTWLWGWLLMLGLTVAWPAWAIHRYPDVVANWKYDYLGRVSGAYTDINEPWYYYTYTWAISLLPWTPACVVGLLATAGVVFCRSPGLVWPIGRGAPWRFVWCWAFVPLLLLSIPHGKHHHYLVPLVAPSAVLAAAGGVEIGRWILRPRGPDWLRNPWLAVAVLGIPVVIATATLGHRLPFPISATVGLAVAWAGFVFAVVASLRGGSGTGLVVALIALLGVGYGWALTFAAAGTDHTADDTAFLARARGEVPPAAPLYIDAKLGPVGNLDFFRIQFYSRPDAQLLHNLSYLRDRRITAPTVYVIARGPAEAALRTLGTTERVDASRDSHEALVGKARYGNFTLFRLTFDPHLTRYPAPTRVTSLQAMERAESTDPGPWCGPPM